METYLEPIEKRVDDHYVSIETLDEMETVIAEGHQESIFCFNFKQKLEETLDRAWHGELRAKEVGNWEECEYYYRLSCHLRELASRAKVKS